MTAGHWLHEGIAMPATTDVQPFPPGFRTENIQANGATLYVRVGGQGPAVVLLHGYGETGDMCAAPGGGACGAKIVPSSGARGTKRIARAWRKIRQRSVGRRDSSMWKARL